MQEQLLALTIALNSLKLQLSALQTTQAPVITTQIDHIGKVNNMVKIKPKTEIEKIILDHAEIYGVDAQMALAVARCESGFKTDAINTNKDGTRDIGLWQINDVHGLSWEFKTDPVKSTRWAMPQLKKNPKIWVCYKKLYG